LLLSCNPFFFTLFCTFSYSYFFFNKTPEGVQTPPVSSKKKPATVSP
jgi:hypothetical protein